MRFVYLILILILIGSAFDSWAQQLDISVTNIRNNKGTIRLAFYSTAESFDEDKAPLFIKLVTKAALIDGTLKVTYKGLPEGEYGIAVLDDENGNQEMDYRFFMPLEGFGFSDYYHTGMTRPKYEKFKFRLGKETRRISIRIRYL